MKLKQLKKLNLFKNEKLQSLEKLHYQGFCNINYKLTSSKKTYLVRKFISDDTVNISRDFEYKTQKKAYDKSIAPQPLYLDKEKTFMITQYQNGIHKQRLNQAELKKLIEAVKKLHKIKVKEKEYDLKRDFKEYSKKLKNDKAKRLIANSLKELKKLKGSKKRYVTTHHDLNPMNIIFYKNSIKFIDWEYVGINDCFFDLATICVEFKLDKKEQSFLLKKYFKKIKKEHKDSLNSYIKIYKALCKLWFMGLK